jgi:hypothetical protein
MIATNLRYLGRTREQSVAHLGYKQNSDTFFVCSLCVSKLSVTIVHCSVFVTYEWPILSNNIGWDVCNVWHFYIRPNIYYLPQKKISKSKLIMLNCLEWDTGTFYTTTINSPFAKSPNHVQNQISIDSSQWLHNCLQDRCLGRKCLDS